MPDEEEKKHLYTQQELIDYGLRTAREAGARAAVDSDAVRFDRDKPLFVTEDRVKELIRQAVADGAEPLLERADNRFGRRLKAIGLNTDDDRIEDTAHRVRNALAFPATAWSFLKWAGGVFGTAILASLAALVMAVFGRSK